VQVEGGVIATAAIQAGTTQTMTVRNPWPGQQAQVVNGSTGAVVVAATTSGTLSVPVTAGSSYLIEQPSSPTTSLTFAQVTGVQATAAKHLGSVQLGLDPAVVYPSLAASYNDVGITADSDTAPGNYDGGGASFSETALTNAGAAPGTTVTSQGLSYSFPNVAAGTDDNTVAEGQTITLSGSGTLGFLVSASYGPATGTGTITYTDGSTQSYTLTSPDWLSTTPPSGGALAVSSAYQNRPGNTTDAVSGNIFSETVALAAGKTVTSITLPPGGALTAGPPALHVFAIAASGGGAEGPYGGTAAAVPGTVQAANYDTGGQGVAYNVTSVNGTADSYRPDGVDLETCSDAGCGYDLGWTAAGQWFRYTVNVATAGTYTVSFRVASPNGVTDALHIANSAGTSLSGAVNVPDTGGWQDWATVTASVTLPAGRQTLTVDQDNGGWNLYYLSFAAVGGSGSALTASPSSLAFGSTLTGSASPAQTVTVANPNSSAVSVSQLAVSGPFGQTSTCGATIAANGSCTVSVTFDPTAVGSASGSLTVASSAAGSPLTVALSGTGAASTTNLALSKPVTASSDYQTYVPSNVTDGNTSTYWESTDGAGYPQTVTVNLGSVQSIGSVTLDLPPSSSWSARTETLSVLGSTNDRPAPSTWS